MKIVILTLLIVLTLATGCCQMRARMGFGDGCSSSRTGK